MASNSFCSIPWIHSATKTNGASRVCCLMSNYEQGNGGQTGHNFKTHTIEEIHNSEYTRNLRKKFLRGYKPIECNTCWVKEKNGGQSRRMFTNRMYKHLIDYEKALEITNDDGSTDQMPVYWDLRFGNLCNLKCVMCGPQSSSMWYKDWAHMYDTDHFEDSGEKIFFKDKGVDSNVYDWYTSSNFWEQMEKNIDQLEHIYLVGGEPMLIEQHYVFLQKLIDKGVSKNVTLEYDTNITNVHQRAIDQWSKFKTLMLRVSIDDYGEQNDYIRFPSKWHKIDKNIQRIQKLVPNTKVEISITWQMLNAYTFLNLLDHFKNYYINIRILSAPEIFDPKQLPKQAKLELIDMYNSSIHKDKIKHLVSYLTNTLNNNQLLYKESADFLNKLDGLRGTDWTKTFKQLHKTINS